jgi:putative heme iron utilization protein
MVSFGRRVSAALALAVSCTAFAPRALLSPSRVPPSSPLFADTEGKTAAADDETVGGASSKAPRHDVGDSARTELEPEVAAAMQAYQEHQQSAPKLDWATDVRTLVQYNHGFAVMSTFSKSDPDYPGGSVVGFAPDERGRPVFVFSGMSAHTQDILANPRCSVTVAAKDFKGAADGRVNLMGRCELIRDPAEREAAKRTYMRKHPGAFWANFGDFNWFRMQVDKVRFVGGFARAGGVTAEEYGAAEPDPVSEFGPDIAKHMNEDHMESTIAVVTALVPGMDREDNPIREALITSVDSLGMYVKVTRESAVQFLPQQFKLRLPFPRPAADRKDVRTLIVEMTQAAAEAATKKTGAAEN